jgi:hypothetical protein
MLPQRHGDDEDVFTGADEPFTIGTGKAFEDPVADDTGGNLAVEKMHAIVRPGERLLRDRCRSRVMTRYLIRRRSGIGLHRGLHDRHGRA